MKLFGLIAVLVCGGVLFYGSVDFPAWGDPQSPASRHLSPYYIQNTLRETAVPNIVTAVVADYRGFDTMFETTVIFTAGMACLLMLRQLKNPAPDSRLYRHISTNVILRIDKGGKLPQHTKEFERIDSVWVPYDLIVKTCCRMIVPFIMLFALYVVAHGHHSPGGGFQGGVIFGAAVILFALCFDMRATLASFTEKTVFLTSAAGVLVYSGTGALCLLLGASFLDYGALAVLLGTDPVMARSHGIFIVEAGVAIAVLAVMVGLYYNLASAGRLDEGL